jgi:hypothetical protein
MGGCAARAPLEVFFAVNEFYFLIFIFGNFRFTAATTLECSGFPELRARASRAWAASSIGYLRADSSAKSDFGSFFRVAAVNWAMDASFSFAK